MSELEIKALAGKPTEKLTAELRGTIEALSSQRGKYRLVITGTANNVDQLATVARMQASLVNITFEEELEHE